jgi:hypothetical protein
MQAAELPPAAQALKETSVSSGLAVIVAPSDTALVESLTAEGRMAVDLLTSGDEDRAGAWRARLIKAGRSGLISVVPLPDFAALPYPDRFANLVIADLDALGEKAPSAKELRRVVAPYGATCLRQGGTWKVEKVGLASELDEWTHADHGADGNPVSHDRVVSYSRGLQWASHDMSRDTTSNPRIGGGVIVKGIRMPGESKFRKGGGDSLLVAREAGNGLLRWQIVETPGLSERRSKVFESSWCIADGRIHGLVGDATDCAQAIDLATGKTVLRYEQGLTAPAGLSKAQMDEGRIFNTHGPYSLGMIHLALDSQIIQGGNDHELKGHVAALDQRTGQRQWLWAAPANLRVGYLAAGDGTVVVALTKSSVALGLHYRNRPVRLAEVVALDARTGAIRWRSDKVDGCRVDIIWSLI